MSKGFEEVKKPLPPPPPTSQTEDFPPFPASFQARERAYQPAAVPLEPTFDRAEKAGPAPSTGYPAPYVRETQPDPGLTIPEYSPANVCPQPPPPPSQSDIPISIARQRQRPWHYNLCACCLECGACLESWCCTPCQQSRQYNFITSRKPEINCPICLAISLLDFIFPCCIVSRFFAWFTRRDIRSRYGIEGSDCGDCCAVCCCCCCSVQQVLLEMASSNEFPGAFCYLPPKFPAQCEMV